MKTSTAAAILGVMGVAAAAMAVECPPIGLASVPDFDVDEYTRATWYVQEQQVNGYQSEDQLYCVTATYDLDTASSVPFFRGTVVAVYNQGDEGGVNQGPQQDPTENVLCARVPDNNNPSKLVVAPCFLPNALSGPYWVVALGRDDSNRYEWAIVSGGEPTVELSNGCTTSEDGINGSGLWIFSREPVLAPEKLLEARDAAVSLGYSLNRMLTVPQEGCKYENRFIKANDDDPELILQENDDATSEEDSDSLEANDDDSELILQDNDDATSEEDSDPLGTLWILGFVASGVVLVVGVAVFALGVVKTRNAYNPRNEEADTNSLTRASQGGIPVYGTHASNVEL